MSTILDRAIAQQKKNLAGHILTLEVKAERFTAYRLHDPAQGNIYSTRILFTPDAIVLTGDLVPERNVSGSSRGYDEAWFAQAKGEHYLAQKFLSKGWQPDLCREELEQVLREQTEKTRNNESLDWSVVQQENVNDLLPRITEMSMGDVADELTDILGVYYDDGPPGWYYDPQQLAVLVAVQHRFAELYNAETRKWKLEAERYRMLIEQSMERYSTQLGWGLTGAQPECWVMLDMAVERMVKQRERREAALAVLKNELALRDGELVTDVLKKLLALLNDHEDGHEDGSKTEV